MIGTESPPSPEVPVPEIGTGSSSCSRVSNRGEWLWFDPWYNWNSASFKFESLSFKDWLWFDSWNDCYWFIVFAKIWTVREKLKADSMPHLEDYIVV